MARKKSKPIESPFVMFDVTYEDGSLSSNRRVAREVVSGLDGDDPVKAHLEAQDREIAERSGRPRGPIKSLRRSA